MYQKIIRMALSILIFIPLSGCQPPPEPLRIVSSPWPGYEPLYLARDLGYLDSAVRLSEVPSANINMEAFSNGSADIATLTLDETLTLLDEGKKVRILLVMDTSNGADAVMARPEIKTLADLKGKRIAMENIPLGVYMLHRTLDAAGLKPSDVTVFPMPEDKHEKAYRSGEVDAVITFEPFKSHIAKAGAHVLFDSSKIPNEIFDLLVVRDDVYKARRDELCDVVQQWFRTLEYVEVNPQDAIGRMAKRLHMEPEAYRAMMGGLTVPSRKDNQHLLGGNNPPMAVSANRLIDIMLKEHLITHRVDFSETIDPTFQTCF